MKTPKHSLKGIVAISSALLIGTAGQTQAAAYKLPESSLNGTALSAAYVANAHGADSSYYNPAAMVFSEDAGSSIEADLTVAYLSEIKFSGLGYPDDKSESEAIAIPTFHYISPAMGNLRYGFSAVTPGGLTKRWLGVGSQFAKEFTLQTIELNPTISYKVNDSFAVGGGLRAIYSKGIVRSDEVLAPAGRKLKGDSWDYGYNLALHFKPSDNLDLSATYRSKIDLTEEGEAWLTSGGAPVYPTLLMAPSNWASVTVPMPAALSLAAAYSFDKTTVELVLERTYWSAYKELDFSYSIPIPGPLGAAFDDPAPKNWGDSNTIRLGVTHELNSKWTLMAGFAYDKTPVDNTYVGFELPDTDAKIISFGAKYKMSDDMTIGAALLYDKKDKLTLTPADGNATFPGGAEFKDATATLLTVGLEYRF
jgi:long-chain fatty acid transport protein